MPCVKKIEQDKFSIIIWKSDEEESFFFQNLDKTVVENIQKIKNSTRRQELYCVRYIISKFLGVKYMLQYAESGKPYLFPKGIQISISHSLGYVAVGYSKYSEIAIDVESISRNFSTVEKKYVSSNDTCTKDVFTSHEKLLYFWVAKEAAIKTNKTISRSMKQVMVSLKNKEVGCVSISPKKNYDVSFFTCDKNILLSVILFS